MNYLKSKEVHFNDIGKAMSSEVFNRIYVNREDIVFKRLMDIVSFCCKDGGYLGRMDRIEKFNVIPFCRIEGEQHIVLMDPVRFLKCLVLQYQYFAQVVYDYDVAWGVMRVIRNVFGGCRGLGNWKFETRGDFTKEEYLRFRDYRIRKYRERIEKGGNCVQNVMMLRDVYVEKGFDYLINEGLYRGSWDSFRQMSVKYFGKGWNDTVNKNDSECGEEMKPSSEINQNKIKEYQKI